MNKKIRIAQSGDSSFAGSGKLSDFKEDGSWIMNQIEKGYNNVQRGVTVDKSTGNIVFSNAHKMVDSQNKRKVFSTVHEQKSNGSLENVDSSIIEIVDKSIKNTKFSDKNTKIASKIVTASEDFKIVKYFKILDANQEFVTVALKLCLFGELNGSSIADLNLVKEFLLNRYYSDCKNLYGCYEIETKYLGDVCIDFNKSCIRLQALLNIITDEQEVYSILTSDCFDYQSANAQEIF